MSFKLLNITDLWPPFGDTGELQLQASLAIEPTLTARVLLNEVDDSMSIATLNPSSDNDVVVTATTLASSDDYVNTASVAWTLRDSDLASVSTGDCEYVTGSNGEYRGTIPSSVSVTDGALYFLDVAVADGSANVLIRKPLVAAYYQGEA